MTTGKWFAAVLILLNTIQYTAAPARSVGEGSDQVGEVVRDRRPFRMTFYCSCQKCTGKSSPERGGKGLTRRGHAPVAWKTAATGDPLLLGRWVFFEDLGHWVFLNDTGSKVRKNQVDLFIGGPEMHKHALRLGVMEWIGEVR